MQLFPIFFRHAMEGFYYLRIKLPTGPIIELLRCRFVRLAATIHPVTRDCVKRICYREDACADVDVLAAQPKRITSAVPLLVMLRHYARRALQKLNAAQDLLSVQRMLAHAYPLFFGELRRLA